MKRELFIEDTKICDDGACYVIAEIGQNHQGDVQVAKEMFLRAKEAGVNAVKLQKRHNRHLYTAYMYNQPYDYEHSFGKTYGQHREALEFTKNEYIQLKKYAKELGLALFATAFDFASIDFLEEIGVPAIKIASGDLTDTPLLKYAAKLGKPILLSTGGGSMDDVQRAYDTVMPINSKLCLLQCTASYPAEPQYLNLRVIETYRRRFDDIVIGLSDHQNGIAMSVAAYILGARVIEKHFTLRHTMKGTDHAFSLEPIGMGKMVRDLQRASASLGDGIKRPYPCEKNAIVKMGKKLVASRDIPKGQVLKRSDIAIKSPGDGLPPYELENLIGKVTSCVIRVDEDFTFKKLR